MPPPRAAAPAGRERIVNRCPRDNSQAPYYRLLQTPPWLNVPCLKFESGDLVYQVPGFTPVYKVQPKDGQLVSGTLVYIIGEGPVVPPPRKSSWLVTYHFERKGEAAAPENVTAYILAGGRVVGSARFLAAPETGAVDYDFTFDRKQMAAGISARVESDGAAWEWPEGQITVHGLEGLFR